MICNNCKTNNSDGAKYCNTCGNRLMKTIKCTNPVCGRDGLPEGSEFCSDYGKKIINNNHGEDFYFKAATSELGSGDYKAAINYYSMAIEVNPKNHFSFIDRGNAKKYIKDYSGANIDYSKAIELNPNYAYSYYLRGFVKRCLDDHYGANQVFIYAAKLGYEDSIKMILK